MAHALAVDECMVTVLTSELSVTWMRIKGILAVSCKLLHPGPFSDHADEILDTLRRGPHPLRFMTDTVGPEANAAYGLAELVGVLPELPSIATAIGMVSLSAAFNARDDAVVTLEQCGLLGIGVGYSWSPERRIHGAVAAIAILRTLQRPSLLRAWRDGPR